MVGGPSGLFWCCHLKTLPLGAAHGWAVVCVVAPAATPQASAGRINIQPGRPANDTASQPGHRAQDEARVVLRRQGQLCPALPSARGRLPGQGGGGLARPRRLTSLPLLHK